MTFPSDFGSNLSPTRKIILLTLYIQMFCPHVGSAVLEGFTRSPPEIQQTFLPKKGYLHRGRRRIHIYIHRLINQERVGLVRLVLCAGNKPFWDLRGNQVSGNKWTSEQVNKWTLHHLAHEALQAAAGIGDTRYPFVCPKTRDTIRAALQFC